MRYIKAGIIFLLTLVAFANFAPQDSGNSQQVTRFGLALSLSEGRVDLDRFTDLTVDIAHFDGHYYADKPPGLSLLAVPAVMLTKAALGLQPGEWPLTQRDFYLLMKAASLSTVGLLAALASAVLYLLARRLGATDAGALFASCGLALATPFFGWSTTFFAHAATGSILLMAVALTVWSRGRRVLWLPPLLGLMLGFELCIDLVSAPAVALIGLFYLLDDRSDWRWRLVGASLGGVVGLLPLLVYNQLAFHSPFTLGYSQVVGFEGMKAGLFGLTAPDPLVALELLFGLHRGLLPLSPLLVLVPLGWWTMWRRPDLQGLAAVSVGILIAFVLVNASYFYWDGGSSTGPRHIVGMLPVVAMALAFAWPEGTMARLAALVLLAVSLFFSAATTVVQIFADSRHAMPLLDPILSGVFTPSGAVGMARMLVPWLGFAMLAVLKDRASGAKRDQLSARPLDAAL